MFGKRQKLKYEAVDSQGDETVDFDPVKKRFLSPNCLWSAFFTAVLISVYYIPSIGLTFYQRWLYQSFHFPLVTVTIHMIVKYLLATVIRIVLIRRQGKPRVLLGWKEFILAVAPTGISSGIDIGFSNWGLELVTVSLYTMTKSTTIVFILAFSILLKLEKKSWSLFFIVSMITVGLMLFTYKATNFSAAGFTLLLLASVSSGVRWSCVQLLLQKSKMGMNNPVDMIYHMQPWMIASVIPFAIAMEGSALIANCQLFRFTDAGLFTSVLFKILIGALIAFFMEFSEVLVVTYTSSLTLAIAGILKEVFMLVLAVEWNGDQLSPINGLGLVVCMCGITCHVVNKIKTLPPRYRYEMEIERHELGDYLIDESQQLDISSESEGEKSDSQVIFDILNRNHRYDR